MSPNRYQSRRIGKKAKPIRLASAPQLDPQDRQPFTRSDLEDVLSGLASAPPVTKSESCEPMRRELNGRYRLVWRR